MGVVAKSDGSPQHHQPDEQADGDFLRERQRIGDDIARENVGHGDQRHYRQYDGSQYFFEIVEELTKHTVTSLSAPEAKRQKKTKREKNRPNEKNKKQKKRKKRKHTKGAGGAKFDAF